MPRHTAPLHLYEEVLLLALRNDKGTVAASVMYQHALGGAILAELIFDGHVRIATEGRSSYAEVIRSARVGDPLLAECLNRIATAKRRAKLETWIERFGNTSGLRHRVAGQLVDKGVLREDEKRMLLLFTRRIYPELDPTHERRIVQRLEQAIYSDTVTVDPRTTVLVALAHHANLLKLNLDRARLKTRKDRIRAVIAGNAIGSAAKQAIEAAQAALAATAVLPAIIASSH